MIENDKNTNEDTKTLENTQNSDHELKDFANNTQANVDISENDGVSSFENDDQKVETATVEESDEKKNNSRKNNESEEVSPIKYSGKWIINTFDGRFFADLKASNGEIMLRTESYSSLSGIKSGIDTLKKNIDMENYAISLDKNGNFVFKIFSTAKRLLCVGEGYSTREQCEKAFASVKRFSKTAVIVVNDKK